jgi:hypothetical protein
LAVGEGDRPESFDAFRAELDPEWIRQALEATGTATMRRRKLPAEHAVWLVIGMGLCRDRPIPSVVHHLGLVLPHGSSPGEITSGAIVKARDRLGVGPMEWLFETSAKTWSDASADAHRWRGLALFGVDGTTLRIADTPENEERFGRPGNNPERGGAAYPQLRVAALMVLRSHLLAGISLGGWSQGEISLAQSLWPKVPDRSLTILDRGFLSYALLRNLSSGGTERHWLIRAKSNLKWKEVEKLGRNDCIIEIAVPRALRSKHPDLPETFHARAVRYQCQGFRAQTLLTSLLDPSTYPAKEIADLYHERWELELGFDELKTHTLEREESLRSRDPDRTLQEVWGLAIGYNLVRRYMEHVAATAEIPPIRISFRGALLLIRDLWRIAWFISPGAIPHHVEALANQVRLLVLPPRRKRKSYPRAVKLKQSNYNRKREP